MRLLILLITAGTAKGTLTIDKDTDAKVDDEIPVAQLGNLNSRVRLHENGNGYADGTAKASAVKMHQISIVDVNEAPAKMIATVLRRLLRKCSGND